MIRMVFMAVLFADIDAHLEDLSLTRKSVTGAGAAR